MSQDSYLSSRPWRPRESTSQSGSFAGDDSALVGHRVARAASCLTSDLVPNLGESASLHSLWDPSLSQIRKPKLREAKSLAQGQTAGSQQTQTQACLLPKPYE